MQVSTGAVDLTTPAWDSPSSKAEISFADARASMLRNSRADVRSDASHDEGDITIRGGRGGGEAGQSNR